MGLNELERVNTEQPTEDAKSAAVPEQPLDQSATVELIEIPSLCLAGTTETAPEHDNAQPAENSAPDAQETEDKTCESK